MNHDESDVPQVGDSVASEAFAHGVLSFHYDEPSDARERRISRAMQAIDESGNTQTIRIPSPASRALRVILSAAASISLVALASMYFFSSTEPQALALLQESIRANESSRIRRFEVRATDRDGKAEQHAHATIDVGSERRFYFNVNTKDGKRLSGGRGESGEWALTARDEIETEKPRAFWPRWMFLLDDSLTGSPDEVLAGIERDYEPKLLGSEEIDGVRCQHIRAFRRDDPRERSAPNEPRRPEPMREDAARGDRPHQEMATPPGVAPELAPFLPPPSRGDTRPDGPRPPRRDGPPGGPQEGREGGPIRGMKPPHAGFMPPDFVPRGDARARMPKVIDLWIDEESKLARRIELRWDAPNGRGGDGPRPGPPASLEFRLIDGPQMEESIFEAPLTTP